MRTTAELVAFQRYWGTVLLILLQHDAGIAKV